MKQDSLAGQTLLAYLRHELCTPINGMIGYSELLLEELQTQPSSPLSEDLQKIQGCSRQLLALVTVILDRDRLALSQIDGDLDNFSDTLRLALITPLSTVIGYCEMLLEDAPARLLADIDKLHGSAQRLLSLIGDIVHLAQQQMQAIALQSEGSALSLESPEAAYLAKSAASTLQALKQNIPKKPSQGGTILVIDDNLTNCELLARQLKPQTYTVTTATNAQQALRLLQAIPYDLILLDVVMPGTSGLDLLQQLKRHDTWRHIPVIMMSALDEIEGAVKCIEIGAEDYLHKPFDPTLLKARIGGYLERQRLRDREVVYLHQVERLTAAAAAVENNNFELDSLNDLVAYPGQLGQLARVFQQMASAVQSREQQLEQRLQSLQTSTDDSQPREIAKTDSSAPIPASAKGNVDIESLYRSSPYPSLSQQASPDSNYSS